MINKTILIGRITENPEIKKTKNGDSVVYFTLAIPRDKSQNTDFINCICYKAIAENLHKHIKKGNMISVFGRLITYTKNKIKYTDVEVSEINYLTPKVVEENYTDDIEIP